MSSQVYTLILMWSPLSHLIMNSFSWPGVKPVRTGSHGPRAPMPPVPAADLARLEGELRAAGLLA